MFLSKHSLLCYSFTLVAAAGLIKHTIAEDGVRTNFHRDDFAFDEAIPLELEEMSMEEANFGTVFNIQQEAQPNELKIAATNSTCITTSIAVVMDYRTKTSKNSLICGTANGNHYEVAGVSDEIIQAKKHLIMNGEIELSIPKGAYLNTATATLKMPTMSKTNQFFKEKRGMRYTDGDDTKSLFDRGATLAVTGTRSVLVVRVVASDVAPSLSEATMSNSVFGNGADGTDDPVTMKGHFNTCSHGQLNFVEADDRDGETILIRNGATTVTIPLPPNSTSEGQRLIENAVSEELRSQFKVTAPNELAEHVMYFYPPGVMPGLATGQNPGFLTKFDDSYTAADWLMHEVGHNLGMWHSGDRSLTWEYGDESCIMGGGFPTGESGPLVCYNAAKSWQMGWHASRNHIYNVADGVWNGRLIGQVDYANENDSTSTVFLKLNTAPGSDDYYVMFNRVVESETTERKIMNLVMIAMAGGEGLHGSHSTVVARLGSGESTILPYFHLWESLELTVNDIDLDANPAYADVTVKMGCLYNCGALLETWTDIDGDTIEELMSGTNNLASPPQMSQRLQSVLEGPTNVDDSYGSRMSGWLVPPVTGDYIFWIASDDNGELWLSTDDNPANTYLACSQPFSSGSREWDEYAEQKSGTISLVAGQAYFYEAFMKEGSGGDNLAIAWQYPGKARDVISASFSRVVNPFQVVGANLDTWTGIFGETIEELRGGTNNLANAPQKSERLQNVLEAPSNVNDNYGSRMSGWLVAPVTGDYQFFIASDDNGEFWLSTDGDPDNKVLICRQPFSAPPRWWDEYSEQKSELISLEAGQSYYYEALMKEGGGGDSLAVAWQYPGQPRNVIPARFSRTEFTWMDDWKLPIFGARLDTWTGIAGNTIEELMSGTNNLASPPQMSEILFMLLEAPNLGIDKYGSRMSGWLVPPVTGDYIFWIASDDNGELWLSTDDNPANTYLACSQPFSSGSREWDEYAEQKSGTISLVAGQAYFYEALMKEGSGGGDNLAIAWQYPGKARDVIPAKFSRLVPEIGVIEQPEPTSEPTPSPTPFPTQKPTSRKPTKNPTKKPTFQPTFLPTPEPTSQPTSTPTSQPTSKKPTSKPTSKKPTSKPTSKKPTSKPTSKKPTRKPF